MKHQNAIVARQQNLFKIGIIFIIVGSFLPWEVWGDFLPAWRYGIQIFPVFADNGGLTPLLISLIILGLVFRTPNFVKRSTIRIKRCAISLVIISIYHFIDWLSHRVEYGGSIGVPEIKIGLILVILGSLLTMLATLFTYQIIPENVELENNAIH